MYIHESQRAARIPIINQTDVTNPTTLLIVDHYADRLWKDRDMGVKSDIYSATDSLPVALRVHYWRAVF